MDERNPHSPLNQAHGYARAAEAFEKAARFDEACICHQKAVELLKKSLEITTFASTQESILLQIEFHRRQEQIIVLKRIQYGIQRQLLAQKEQQMIMEQKETCLKENKDKNLQWAIYKNIEAVDSLINTLADRESKPLDESEDLGSGNAYSSCMKHPKNDSTVIEELHTLNSKLRELISQLLNQLEESQKEASLLREKVKFYESLPTKKDESNGEQNLIDFNSLSSSGESIGIIP